MNTKTSKQLSSSQQQHPHQNISQAQYLQQHILQQHFTSSQSQIQSHGHHASQVLQQILPNTNNITNSKNKQNIPASMVPLHHVNDNVFQNQSQPTIKPPLIDNIFNNV